MIAEKRAGVLRETENERLRREILERENKEAEERRTAMLASFADV